MKAVIYARFSSEQHMCDKKTIKKEWIEDLVIAEIEKLLANDDIIEELADRIYELQTAADRRLCKQHLSLFRTE